MGSADVALAAVTFLVAGMGAGWVLAALAALVDR
jgi:hypothetical protein